MLTTHRCVLERQVISLVTGRIFPTSITVRRRIALITNVEIVPNQKTTGWCQMPTHQLANDWSVQYVVSKRLHTTRIRRRDFCHRTLYDY